MQNFFKRIVSFFLVPLTKWYLRKERSFTYRNIEVKVLPGVFHPGFFFSTKFLLEFLSKQNLADKTFLELGCGSGLISIAAAKAGAYVTALDLSKTALENTTYNAKKNHIDIEIIHSDLFNDLKKKSFDWIIINPPYYPRPAVNETELAWHCGPNFEYFTKLFQGITDYMHASTRTIMVLSQDCDIKKIISIAGNNGLSFEQIETKKVWLDQRNFLFSIMPQHITSSIQPVPPPARPPQQQSSS
jgi:release factor glutamine methyltransferase